MKLIEIKKGGYSARYDLIFQYAMCTEENKDILKWFLEKILEKKIDSIVIETPIVPISRITEKKKAVDLLVTCGKEKINIEINNGHYAGLDRRNFSYAVNTYSASAKVGKDYIKMPDFMQINFTWGLDSKIYRYDMYEFEMQDGRRDIKYIDNFKIIVYNMDYLERLWYNEGEVALEAPKHLMMLNMPVEKLKEYSRGDKIMEKFSKNVENLNSNSEVIEFLSKEEEELIRENSIKSASLEQGIEQGSNKRQNEIVRNMLEEKADDNFILKVTGITLEELEAIKKKLN